MIGLTGMDFVAQHGFLSCKRTRNSPGFPQGLSDLQASSGPWAQGQTGRGVSGAVLIKSNQIWTGVTVQVARFWAGTHA
jgi:hypothetical protein